jgi:hypothetical protein
MHDVSLLSLHQFEECVEAAEPRDAFAVLTRGLREPRSRRFLQQILVSGARELLLDRVVHVRSFVVGIDKTRGAAAFFPPGYSRARC